jgi:hypothetical protein
MSSQCAFEQGRCTSNWTRLPLHLHRISTAVLISLTVIQLHSSERSLTLAAVFLIMAAVGIVVDKSSLSTQTVGPASSASTCKARFAISLIRATVYAFIGDLAAAQLLWASPEPMNYDAPLVLTTENWIQFGLAGCMWLLAAFIWITEPLVYWINYKQWKSSGNGAALEEGYIRVPAAAVDEEDAQLLNVEETYIIWEVPSELAPNGDEAEKL